MTLRHEWTLGGLALVKPRVRPKSGFWFETTAAGWDLGSPDGTLVVRDSLLRDGDDSYIEGYRNREIRFLVAVAGYDTDALAQGEKALVLQVNGGPNTLRYVPPDGVGHPTRFEVRTSQMRYVSDDFLLAQPGVRYAVYEVVLDCAPWAYADTETEQTFTRAVGTPTVVDACTSAANWPGLTAGTYLTQSVVSTGRYGGTSGNDGPTHLDISRTASVAGANYLYVDLAVEGGNLTNALLLNGGAPLAAIPQSNGFTRYVVAWGAVGGPFTVRAKFTVGDPNGPGARLHINEVGTMATLPSASLLALTMRGSVPVPARLRIHRVVTESAALGTVFVYSDPSMLANGWDPKVFETWANAPDGEYVFYVRLASAAVAGDTVSVTFLGITSSTVLTESAGSGAGARWIPVAPFQLGGRRDRELGSSAIAADWLDKTPVVKLNGVTNAAAVRLFRDASRDNDVALTSLRSLPATSRYLFIDPPTLDQPFPGIFSGEQLDGSDAVSRLTLADAWAWHRMVPETTGLFVECSTVTNPIVKSVQRDAYHTFAASA